MPPVRRRPAPPASNATPDPDDRQQFTEREMRADMIAGLRQFQVWFTRAGEHKTEVVIAHRSAIGNDGVLMFQVDTMDSAFVRRAFKSWDDMQEIVVIDNNCSGRPN